MPELSLLTLNIDNPSPGRAERQLGWLAARDEDVLVLTETKNSAGCRLLADAFSGAGYHISYSKPEDGDYGVMIASRVQARTKDFGDRFGYVLQRLPHGQSASGSLSRHVVEQHVTLCVVGAPGRRAKRTADNLRTDQRQRPAAAVLTMQHTPRSPLAATTSHRRREKRWPGYPKR